MTSDVPFSRSRTARRWCVLTALAVSAMAGSVLVQSPPLVLWNASASVPVGLYIVIPGAPLINGNLAVSRLPLSVRKLAADREYLPANVLLIKPVAATSGAKICRIGDAIYVNDRWIAAALPQDRLHRELPAWRGCRTLSPDQIFLANPAVSDSFDGRYFGPTGKDKAVGRAFPVLTFPSP